MSNDGPGWPGKRPEIRWAASFRKRVEELLFGFLKTNAFPGEPEKTIQYEILVVTLGVIVSVYAFGLIYIALVPIPGVLLRLSAGPALLVTASILLLRRKNLELASKCMCYGLLACLMFSIYHAGGLTALGVPALMTPLLIASFTLGRRVSTVLFIVTVGYLFFLASVQVAGKLPVAYYSQRPYMRAAMNSLYIASSGVLVGWAVHRIEHSRRQTLREHEARQVMERQVRALNLELETRVKSRTAQIEEFSAMVAHDLRTPVIHVKGYSRLLGEKVELDEEARFFISRLINSAETMGEIIDRLVEFHHKKSDILSENSVDMTALAQSVLLDMVASSQIPEGSIYIDQMPAAVSDLALVQELWSCIFQCAAGRCQLGKTPQIVVRATVRDGEDWYLVSESNPKSIDGGSGSSEQDYVATAHAEAHPLDALKLKLERFGGELVVDESLQSGFVCLFKLPTGTTARHTGKPVLEG